MPEKIEGIALIDQSTIAVSNDNDFDSEESKYDAAGNNIGKGKISQILSYFSCQAPAITTVYGSEGFRIPLNARRCKFKLESEIRNNLTG